MWKGVPWQKPTRPGLVWGGRPMIPAIASSIDGLDSKELSQRRRKISPQPPALGYKRGARGGVKAFIYAPSFLLSSSPSHHA